jgi:hypothetical protein
VVTVESWVQRAATLPAVLVDSTPPAVRAGAEVLETRARANLLAATGGDLRLSRARSIRAARRGGGGQRVDVKVSVAGSGRRAEARVLPVGPVSLVEGPTRRHRIPRAYSSNYTMGRRRKADRRAFIWIPGIGFRSNAQHPGTKGKRPVRRAMQTSADEAGRAGLAVFAAAARDHLTRGRGA